MEFWLQIAVGTAALLALLASVIEGARLWQGWRRAHASRAAVWPPGPARS